MPRGLFGRKAMLFLFDLSSVHFDQSMERIVKESWVLGSIVLSALHVKMFESLELKLILKVLNKIP